MTRLILVRHTEPAEDARGRCYGSLDVGLSPAGEAHALRLGQALAAEPLAAIYASPRLRALQTAAAIASPHGVDAAVEEDLRELDLGELEGRTYDEIARSEPDLYRRWMETPTEVQFPGGESYTSLRERVVALTETLRARHAEETIVTVAHGGVVRVILAHCLELPAAAIFRIDQRYGAVNLVEWIGDFPLVRLVNADL